MQLEIRRVLIRKAYAQNGNVGREKKYYQWWIYRDGQYISGERLLRDAKSEVASTYPGCSVSITRPEGSRNENEARNDY